MEVNGMRRLFFVIGLTGALLGAPALVASANDLPAAACNDGTMNAHSRVPETTGNGTAVHAHEAIPESEDGAACSHGG
jgi:hypothetical protein